jgi:hypothetical protein
MEEVPSLTTPMVELDEIAAQRPNPNESAGVALRTPADSSSLHPMVQFFIFHKKLLT